jgi:hypothetical protein
MTLCSTVTIDYHSAAVPFIERDAMDIAIYRRHFRSEREVPMVSSARAPSMVMSFIAWALAVTLSAHAASKFDGVWSVTAFTRHGPCDPRFHFRVRIANGIVRYLVRGIGRLSARVSPSGSLHATGSIGPAHGVGSGRLSRNSGRGTWRGASPNESCSGTWRAHRN